MKKLMFAALAAAAISGAYADPLVYKYRSSVKHMYLKPVNTGLRDTLGTIELYMKVTRSADLVGYLVMDADGVTSKTASNVGTCSPTTTGTTSYDFGRNRGFLVVLNTTKRADEDLVATPKIIPAILDAKWIDQRWNLEKMPLEGLAEGTLFCGGDSIPCVRTILDGLARSSATVTDRGEAPQLPAANGDTGLAGTAGSIPGMTAYADYVWTSVYLFGQYNGPNWYYDTAAKVGPYYTFEQAWDENLPATLQIHFAKQDEDGNVMRHPYFHDTWMNGAGFGLWWKPSEAGGKRKCCGLAGSTPKTYDIVLNTLNGEVKGGLFLCTENAIRAYVSNYDFFGNIAAPTPSDTWRWENQFVTPRLVGAVTFNPDAYQNDMWQDGSVEQETTDVISGTWKIGLKWGWAADNAEELTAAELANIGLGLQEKDDNGDEQYADDDVVMTKDDVQYGLVCTLKGAAYDLVKSEDNGFMPFVQLSNGTWKQVVFCDGSENHAMSVNKCSSVEEGLEILPVVTPQFAKYYGLVNLAE